MIEHSKLFIGGEWRPPASSTRVTAIGASTEEVLGSAPLGWLGTRVLAPRSRYVEVVDTISGLAASLKIGPASDPGTQIGPLVSSRQRERVESYIAKRRVEGGKVTVGGGRPIAQEKGRFAEPAIIADVKNGDPIAREEILGPVLAVVPCDDEADAVNIANAYGLGGSVWTSDPDRGEAVARRIHAGTVGVNAYPVDPVAPFGGVKASGMGRELGPEDCRASSGLRPFTWIPASRDAVSSHRPGDDRR